VSNEHTPRYTNAEKNRPFSGLQHQAQFGLNPALSGVELENKPAFGCLILLNVYKIIINISAKISNRTVLAQVTHHGSL